MSGTTRFLVTGGTGNTGVLIVKELLKLKQESPENKIEITVTYRNDTKFNKLYQDEIDSVCKLKLDLSNFDSYPKDLSCFDTIIIGHGSDQFITPIRFFKMLFYQLWPLHPYYIEYQALNTLVNTAKQTNPQIKFIVLSTMGTLEPYWFPTLILNGLICGVAKYKYFANQCLRLSGLNYIIIRPPGLVDDPNDNDNDNNNNNKQNENSQMIDKKKDKFDFENRKLCMNQYFQEPLKGIKFSNNDAAIMSRKQLAKAIAQCSADSKICKKENLEKATINIWQGYEKDLKINKAQLLNWDNVHNDTQNDLDFFSNINHDTPYWICMSILVSLIALILFFCLY